MTVAGRRGLLALVVAVALPLWSAPAAADLTRPPDPLIDDVPPATAWPDPPTVAAPVHLLIDAATGQVLSADDADEPRPVASTVKILTALTVADRLDLDDPVVVGDEVVDVEGASVQLEPGERWTVEQLLQAILVRSGNDAARALAVAVGGDADGFVTLMQQTARQVGLDVGPEGAVITSPSGLDDDQRFSARDLATLGRVLLADPELRGIVAAEAVSLPGVEDEENRNLLIGDYPGATGIKTGFTEAAGNSLVGSARRGDRELIVVVLGGGPDPERFADAAALLDHGFTAFEDRDLSAELTLLVAGGTRTLTAGPFDVVVPSGTDAAVDLPVPIRPPDAGTLAVPVTIDGTPVATATATVDGSPTPVSDGAGARLGRAAADGVYAALRAAHVADADR